VQSDLFSPGHAEVAGAGIQKQGGKMVRVALAGEVLARSGSMVAYQGDMRFEALGAGGIGNLIRQRLSGEGVPLMKVTGRGDLFLANAASDVHLIDLDGSDGLTINGANVLAFDSTLSYRIGRVQGAAGLASNAGLFNCVFTGHGRIAITTEGTPVVLDVDQPTYADPQAAVAWSSSLRTGITSNDSFNLGTLMGRSTGERVTLSFSGRGFVIVQPSELPPAGSSAAPVAASRPGSAAACWAACSAADPVRRPVIGPSATSATHRPPRRCAGIDHRGQVAGTRVFWRATTHQRPRSRTST